MLLRDGIRKAGRRAKRAVRHTLFRRHTSASGHWFDHPEMKARIAESEADVREGRTRRFDSREEAFAFVDSLA